MQIFRHTADIPLAAKGQSVAIGNFDGIHKGHQEIFKSLFRIASKGRTGAAVLTFEPHPRRFFAPEAPPFRLTPFHLKARLLEEMGFDYLYCLTFDKDMASLGAEDFIKTILVDGLGVANVVIGENFHFGAKRSGNAKTLADFGKTCGFSVLVHDIVPQKGNIPVSSTAIRQHLRQRNPQKAADLLGRPFVISSHVITGKKQGRSFGFPTANLALDGYIEPAYGIYAVRVCIHGTTQTQNSTWHPAVASLGINPMFAVERPLLEVHILDFNGDLYGKRLSVSLLDFLRGEEKFPTIEALKGQMQKDCAQAREILHFRKAKDATLLKPLGAARIL